MSVHGGPEWHQRDAYDAESLALVDEGYAVALVNYRGSTGYGIPLRETLTRNIGFPESEDVVACLDALVDDEVADPDHAFFVGWSWGGYLACLNAGINPGRWRALVAGIPTGRWRRGALGELTAAQGLGRRHHGRAPGRGARAVSRTRSDDLRRQRSGAECSSSPGSTTAAARSSRRPTGAMRSSPVEGRRAVHLRIRTPRERVGRAGAAHAAHPGVPRPLPLRSDHVVRSRFRTHPVDRVLEDADPLAPALP